MFCCVQEVNENSLQKLNGYLERLNKFGGYSIQPVKLTFYVRDTKDNSDVQKGTSPPGTLYSVISMKNVSSKKN